MDRRRRQILIHAGSTLLISLIAQPGWAAQVIGVRLWPAPAYTRITIEHAPEGLVYSTQLLKEPLRFVLDLEGVTLNPALRELTARVTNDDPFIRAIRVAQFQPRVVRLVFELKQEINPQ
ncbi:MAG: AMIN domain-containing protein, partial [Betaproteobacteria bacterium]|nr:AMIN domain-containing protein [Betaproteobacteria bacterium]